MLTYANPKLPRPGFNEENGFEEMLEPKLPDIIEIGERNTCWMRVSRKQKLLMLIDKVTGKTTAKVPIDEHFAQVASERHHLNWHQIGAAVHALRLK